MNDLEELGRHLEEIQSKLPLLNQRVDSLKSQLDALSGDTNNHHWMECTSGSSIVHKYQCTNCGYISTFQGMKCPKCRTKMR